MKMTGGKEVFVFLKNNIDERFQLRLMHYLPLPPHRCQQKRPTIGFLDNNRDVKRKTGVRFQH